VPAGDSFRVITGLAQTNGINAPDCFRTPLLVRLSVPGPDTTLVIRPVANPQVDTFTVGGNPSGLTVDPDDWILDSSYVVHTGIEEDERSGASGEKKLPSVIRGVLLLPRSLDSSTSACLLDVSGRKLLDLHPGSNDLSRIAPGVYFVAERRTGGQPSAMRVVVAR